ncbi:DUF2851 family protein, partial [Candidatus Sumerlaeota bacterium]|nr:DUF2851 family protein [Candidatus Sumerlaeota bacterium]
QALMTAMGHRGSKTLFFLLSKRVPLAELRSLTRPWSDPQRALAAQAVLLHVANLVPARKDADPSWDDETMAYLDAIHRVWAELGGHFSDRIIPPTRQWHRGMRPTAFPSRRIAGISHVVTDEWTHGGVFRALARRCRDFADDELSEKTLRTQIKTLESLIACEAPGDHWARRHTIGGKRLESPSRLIGQAQARSVIFNALLPLVLLHARANRDRPLAKWAQSAIRHFPALAENTVTRFMKYRVFGTADPPPSLFRREFRHQALFHIFTACCDHSTTSCERCAFFSRLKS